MFLLLHTRTTTTPTLFPYTTLFRSGTIHDDLLNFIAEDKLDLDGDIKVKALIGIYLQLGRIAESLREKKAPKNFQFVTERSEEHTSELQSPCNLVCRLLLEKKKDKQ